MGLKSKIGKKLRPVALWTDTHTHARTDGQKIDITNRGKKTKKRRELQLGVTNSRKGGQYFPSITTGFALDYTFP